MALFGGSELAGNYSGNFQVDLMNYMIRTTNLFGLKGRKFVIGKVIGNRTKNQEKNNILTCSRLWYNIEADDISIRQWYKDDSAMIYYHSTSS